MSTTLLYVALVLAGVAAGFLNTVAGGGSMLTLPVLMLLGLPADMANGTNRLSVVTQSVAGVLGFRTQGKLDQGALVPVLVPTVAGALVGSISAARMPAALLEYVLLGSMMAMAVIMTLFPRAVIAPPGTPAATGARRVAGLACMFVAGLYGGFVQAGVGFLLLGALSGVLRYIVLACVIATCVAALSQT